MGEPDEMKPGRGEFHEYPSSCICRNYSAFHEENNHHDEDQTSLEEVPFSLDTNSRYKYGDDKPKTRVKETGTTKGTASVLEIADDDEFLAN